MKLVVLPPTPGTVAAYLRVSSRVQRDRETIASQREAVLEHAGGCGWTVPKERVFADDGFSGATLDRPALEALRDAVAGGEVETILAWSADRLSRNFAHQMLLQEEFARHGARIVFVQEPDDATPQGMLLRQMLSAISEYERTQIAERSRRGKIHRARQGSLNMISRPPYGYRLIRKTEACGARLEIDEAEAAVVRRIYDLYVREGLKMHAVSRRLDAEGIRPRHAECWPTATVAVILRNEAYVGRAAYLKTVGTGKPARRNRTGRRKAGTVRRLTGRAVRPREEWIELPFRPSSRRPSSPGHNGGGRRIGASRRARRPIRRCSKGFACALSAATPSGGTPAIPARDPTASAFTITDATALTAGVGRKAPSATIRRSAPTSSTPRFGGKCSPCSRTRNWSGPKSIAGSRPPTTPHRTTGARRPCAPSRPAIRRGCAACSTPTRKASSRSRSCASGTPRCKPGSGRCWPNSTPCKPRRSIVNPSLRWPPRSRVS